MLRAAPQLIGRGEMATTPGRAGSVHSGPPRPMTPVSWRGLPAGMSTADSADSGKLRCDDAKAAGPRHAATIGWIFAEWTSPCRVELTGWAGARRVSCPPALPDGVAAGRTPVRPPIHTLDRDDSVPFGGVGIKHRQDPHDLVEVGPHVPVFQAADRLPGQPCGLGQLLRRDVALFAQPDQFGGEPAATHVRADHGGRPAVRRHRSDASARRWDVGRDTGQGQPVTRFAGRCTSRRDRVSVPAVRGGRLDGVQVREW